MNILTEALWRDEAFTALLARHNPLDLIQISAGDSNPPLYFLLVHWWTSLFGETEVPLRLLGVMFLLGTATVMYFIGKEFGKGVGWWLALLTLTQPFLFNYAFEARSYSLLGLLTALCLYFYLKRRYLPLALAGIAILYTHIFGVWVVLVILGWMVYRREPWWWTAIPIVCFLPWIPNYLSFAQAAGSFLGPPGLKDLLDKIILLGLPALVLTLPFSKKVLAQPKFGLAAGLIVMPILGTFLISQFRPIFLERYLIVAIPGELLILGWALAERSFRPAAAALLAIQIALSAYLFAHPTKPPFNELAAYIKAQIKPEDLVLNGSALTYFESQYYGLNGQIYSPKNDVPYYIGKALIPDRDILTQVPPAKRYFLINLDEPGGVLATPPPAKLLDEKSFGRLKLSLYEP